MKKFVHFRAALVLLAAAVTLGTSACTPKVAHVPPGTIQADKFLFDRGTEALNTKKWIRAREYFREIVDNYPQSAYRPDAKLGLADTYLGEGSAESLVQAQNEYREFLTFFPTHPRADYAQYKLGLTHFAEMLGPERDQTQTRETIKEFELFVERYPNSTLMPEARAKLREARDRLSEHEYKVGYFYFRTVKWYPAAVDRFKGILKDDPEFTNRDAVYYYLGESLVNMKLAAEALPYYERLVKEFQTSEYLDKAKQRIAELTKTMARRDGS